MADTRTMMSHAVTDTRHEEAVAVVAAQSADLFAYLDDQARLGGHMERRSLMMMGGRMTYEFDGAQGRAVGSVITMRGRFLGVRIEVVESVTERSPSQRKAWETVGVPRMLIIARYRMGFDLTPDNSHTRLRVFIDYERPKSSIGNFLGAMFARSYARWCVGRMTGDAVAHFRRPAPLPR